MAIRLKLGAKISLSFALLVLLLLSLSGVSLYSFSEMQKSSKHLAANYKQITQIFRLKEITLNIQLALMEMTSSYKENAPDELQKHLDHYQEIIADYDLIAMNFQEALTDEEQMAIGNKFLEQLDRVNTVMNEELIPTVSKQDGEKNVKLIEDLDFKIDGIAMEALTTANQIMGLMASNVEAAKLEHYRVQKFFTFIKTVTIIAFLIAILISFIMNRHIRRIIDNLLQESQKVQTATQTGNLDIRGDGQKINFQFRPIVEGMNSILNNITTPLNEAKLVLAEMEKKNLTLLMQGEYSGDYATLKHAINTVISSFQHVLTETKEAVNELHLSTKAVATTSEELSDGATQQASSLQQITSSVNEIGGQAKHNAENSQEAKRMGDLTEKSASLGQQRMQETITAMNRIKNSSENITEILKAIDEIAFQTNLLSLNAAVEAARAGKHGKGFAVVAEEVRNLATRSSKAAKETAEIVDVSNQEVSMGVAVAEETGKALNAIVEHSNKISKIVGEIAHASNDQAHGVEQIMNALVQLDMVTQKNTASAEQAASAAKDLSNQSEKLYKIVEDFHLS